MENLLVDLMYDAPDQKNLKKIVINKDVVIKKNEPMLMFANKENTKIAPGAPSFAAFINVL